MAWSYGGGTIGAGASQRWWLWWPGDPGLEVIGVECVTAGVELRYTTPGVSRGADGSTTYLVTVTNAGRERAEFRFRGAAGGWTSGNNTLAAGQTQRWWLWWERYPGVEHLGVQAITPNAELRYTTPGVQINADGSATYFIDVTNTGTTTVQYRFRGFPSC